jgi:Phage capsid protein
MPSPTIDEAFIIKFNDDAHLAFQQRASKIRGTVRTDASVMASKVRFQKIGTTIAKQKARNGDIPPSNPEHTYAEAIMEDWYDLILVDQLDLTKLNIEIRGNYIKTLSYSFGRKTDDILLAAMQAGATNNMFAYTGNLDRNNALLAVEALQRLDVDLDGNIFALVSPRGWAHLMAIQEFASSDYVGPDLPYLKRVDARTWYGVNWIVHNRLPGIGTAQVKYYLYHSSAIGHGINADLDITWDWENPKKAWSAAASMSMGGVVIDTNGIIELRLNDTAALPAVT